MRFLLFFVIFFSHNLFSQNFVFKRYHRENGLVSDYVNAIFQDSKGFIWIASDKGVSRYDGKKFLHFNTDKGLAGNMVTNIWEDARNYVWFEIYEKPLCYWDGKKMNVSKLHKTDNESAYFKRKKPFYIAAKKSDSILKAIEKMDSSRNVLLDTLLDYEGNHWTAVFGKGVYKFIPHLQHLALNDEIVNFYQKNKEEYYLMGRKGIYAVKGGVLAKFIPLADVRALVENNKNEWFVGTLYNWYPECKLDNLPKGKHCTGISDVITFQNNLWISTFGIGIVRLSEGKKDTLSVEKNGLVSASIERLLKTQHFFWATTYGNGISQITFDGKIKNFKVQQGLLSDITYNVYEENQDTFWVSTELGISVFKQGRLFRNIPAKEKIMAVHQYRGKMYAVSEKYLYQVSDSALHKIGAVYLYPPDVLAAINRVFADENIIYICHSQGFSKIDLAQIPLQSHIKPKISLVEVSYPNDSQNATIVLENPNDHVRIRVAGLSFLNEDENTFRYRIREMGANWSELRPIKELVIGDLDYKDYHLEIQIYNANGIASESLYQTIKVMTPYWRTTWFLLLVVLVGLGIFAFTIRYVSYRRLRNKLKKLELQQKIQQERERIARDLHDNVGSQLTYIIASLEDTAKSIDIKSRNKLEELSDFARQTINQLRETIWAIHSPQITLESFESKIRDLVWNYTKNFQKPKMVMQIHLDQEKTLNSVQALNLYRIIQEALNNAFKHSQAKEIVIKLQTVHGYLKMEIYDDGKGFEKEKCIDEQHYGLKNMQSRAEEIGAHLDIQTAIHQGFKISLMLPLQNKRNER
jgi:signal transduction histidine kinase